MAGFVLIFLRYVRFAFDRHPTVKNCYEYSSWAITMNLFFWKKNRNIDIFASDLANEFYSRVQPDAAHSFFEKTPKDKHEKKSRKQTEATIQDAIKRLEQFRITNSLGVYGKARFHLKFTERLKELGYGADIAKRINEFIMLKTP